jgi:transposase
VSERKRPNQAGGFTAEARAHNARLRYIAIAGRAVRGVSDAEVAAQFGVCRQTVVNARRAIGAPRKQGGAGTPRPWQRTGPGERVMARLRLAATGKSNVAVAAEFGVSHQCVALDKARWPEVFERLKWEHASGDAREGGA